MNTRFRTTDKENRLLSFAGFFDRGTSHTEVPESADKGEKQETVKGGDKTEQLKKQVNDLQQRLKKIGEETKDESMRTEVANVEKAMQDILDAQSGKLAKLNEELQLHVDKAFDVIKAADARAVEAERRIKNPTNFKSEGKDANGWTIYTMQLSEDSFNTVGPHLSYNGTARMRYRDCRGSEWESDVRICRPYASVLQPGHGEGYDESKLMHVTREQRDGKTFYRVALHPGFNGGFGFYDWNKEGTKYTRVETASFRAPDVSSSITVDKEGVQSEIPKPPKEPVKPAKPVEAPKELLKPTEAPKESEAALELKRKAAALKEASDFSESQYETVTGFPGLSNISRPDATKRFIQALENEEAHLKMADAKDTQSQERLKAVQSKLGEARSYLQKLSEQERAKAQEIAKEFKDNAKKLKDITDHAAFIYERVTNFEGQSNFTRPDATKKFISALESEEKHLKTADPGDRDSAARLQKVQEMLAGARKYLETLTSREKDKEPKSGLELAKKRFEHDAKILVSRIVQNANMSLSLESPYVVEPHSLLNADIAEFIAKYPGEEGFVVAVCKDLAERNSEAGWVNGKYIFELSFDGRKFNLKKRQKSEEKKETAKEVPLKLPSKVEIGKPFSFEIPADTKEVGVRILDKSVPQLAGGSKEYSDALGTRIVRTGNTVTVTLSGQNKPGKYTIVLNGQDKAAFDLVESKVEAKEKSLELPSKVKLGEPFSFDVPADQDTVGVKGPRNDGMVQLTKAIDSEVDSLGTKISRKGNRITVTLHGDNRAGKYEIIAGKQTGTVELTDTTIERTMETFKQQAGTLVEHLKEKANKAPYLENSDVQGSFKALSEHAWSFKSAHPSELSFANDFCKTLAEKNKDMGWEVVLGKGSQPKLELTFDGNKFDLKERPKTEEKPKEPEKKGETGSTVLPPNGSEYTRNTTIGARISDKATIQIDYDGTMGTIAMTDMMPGMRSSLEGRPDWDQMPLIERVKTENGMSDITMKMGPWVWKGGYEITITEPGKSPQKAKFSVTDKGPSAMPNKEKATERKSDDRPAKKPKDEKVVEPKKPDDKLKGPEKKPEPPKEQSDFPANGAEFRVGDTVKLKADEKATVQVNDRRIKDVAAISSTELTPGKNGSREGLPPWDEMPIIERKSTAGGVSNVEIKIGPRVWPGEYELLVYGTEKPSRSIRFFVKGEGEKPKTEPEKKPEDKSPEKQKAITFLNDLEKTARQIGLTATFDRKGGTLKVSAKGDPESFSCTYSVTAFDDGDFGIRTERMIGGKEHYVSTHPLAVGLQSMTIDNLKVFGEQALERASINKAMLNWFKVLQNEAENIGLTVELKEGAPAAFKAYAKGDPQKFSLTLTFAMLENGKCGFHRKVISAADSASGRDEYREWAQRDPYKERVSEGLKREGILAVQRAKKKE